MHLHQEGISLSVNRESLGSNASVLVNETSGRRDERENRTSGRTEDFRLVHFENIVNARPGDVVEVTLKEASAHYFVGNPLSVRTTRGGDAHEARTRKESAPSSTMLGIPQVRP